VTAEVHQIILIPTPRVRGRCLSVSAEVSLSLVSSLGIHRSSYCVESRFQLGMLRLLDEYVLVVNVLDDVYVAIL